MVKYLLCFLFLISNLSIAQEFTALNGIPGGHIKRMQEDPNGKLYVLEETSGNVFTSTDTGNTWQVLTSVSQVGFFFVGSQVLIYGSQEYFYRSTDGGTSWERVGNVSNSLFTETSSPLDFDMYESVVSENTIIAAHNSKVFVSIDLGITWNPIYECLYPESLDNNQRLAQTKEGDLYWATDSGVYRHKYPQSGEWDITKTELIFQPNQSNFKIFGVFASKSGGLFINYYDFDVDNNMKIVSSATGDLDSWQTLDLTGVPTETDINGLISAGGNIYINGGKYDNQRIWKLTDEVNGSWEEKTHPGKEYGYVNDNGINLFQNSTGIMFTLSRGQQSDFLDINRFKYGWGIFRSGDEGNSWILSNGSGNQAINYGDSYDLKVLPNNNIVVLPAAMSQGVFVSTDQGFTFNFIKLGATINYSVGQTIIIKKQDNSLLIPAYPNMVKSNDGINWTSTLGDYSSDDFFWDKDDIFRMSRQLMDTLSIFQSTDEATNWQEHKITGLPNQGELKFGTIHNGDIFLAVLLRDSNYTIYKVDYSGDTWVANELNLPEALQRQEFTNEYIRSLVSSNGKLYFGNGNKIGYSMDKGVSWSYFTFPHATLISIEQKGALETDPIERGIGISSKGNFTITQNDDEIFANYKLPKSNSILSQYTQKPDGSYVFSTFGGPAYENEAPLLLPPSAYPLPLNISWEPLNGPYGGSAKVLSDENGILYSIMYLPAGNVLFRFDEATAKWNKILTTKGQIENFYCNGSDIYIRTDRLSNISSYSERLEYKKLFRINTEIIEEIQEPNSQNATPGLVVANNGNLLWGGYISNDKGNSWQLMDPFSESFSPRRYLKISNGTIWAIVAAAPDFKSVFYKSMDNGITWTLVNTDIISSNEIISNIYELEEQSVIIVGQTNLYKSSDEGVTWNIIEAPGSLEAEIIIGPNENYYLLRNAQIFISENKGQNWGEAIYSDDLNPTGQFSPRNIIFQEGRFIFGADQGIFTSNASLDTLQNISFGFTGKYNLVENDNGIITASNNDITISSDQDITIISNNDGASFEESSEELKTLYLQDGRIVKYGRSISISEDNGLTYTSYNNDFVFLDIYTNDEVIFYAYIWDVNDNLSSSYLASSDDLITWSYCSF